MDSRILCVDFYMQTIIRWRSHNLTWISDWAAQLDLGQVEFLCERLQLLRRTGNHWKVRDERIAHRKWPTIRRQRFERTGDIVDRVILNQPEAITVETA